MKPPNWTKFDADRLAAAQRQYDAGFPEIERCCVCDEPTGGAGRHEDSRYCSRCDNGPFCEEHAREHHCRKIS